jgi:hypothetical protein
MTYDSDFYGPNRKEKKLRKSTQAVLRLVGSISKTNRNITAKIWFSSLKVVYKLREMGLNFVGPIKTYKRAIAARLLWHKNKEPGNSIYDFVKDKMLLSLSL